MDEIHIKKKESFLSPMTTLKILPLENKSYDNLCQRSMPQYLKE
jgi:hypothetical protein